MVELPFSADCCPCVERLRTGLPLTVGIREGVVHLVPTLGSVVTQRWVWVVARQVSGKFVYGVMAASASTFVFWRVLGPVLLPSVVAAGATGELPG